MGCLLLRKVFYSTSNISFFDKSLKEKAKKIIGEKVEIGVYLHLEQYDFGRDLTKFCRRKNLKKGVVKEGELGNW